MTDDTLRVAYQGEPGAFSEEALRRWFPDGASGVPCRDFDRLVQAVARGDARYGVLPVENTLAGTVGAACDAFLDAELTVLGEVVHPIRHCLLATQGATFDQLREVRSHPVALAQCRGFFKAHPELRAVPVHDTAGAAREVRDAGDPSIAAIAAAGAAEAYGLARLRSDLQDRDDNQTRFWIIAASGTPAPPAPATHLERSLVAFATRNRPGALVRVLRALAESGFNLTSLVARPATTPWTYRFLAEVEGAFEGSRGDEALDEARRHALELRVLGPYGVLDPARAPEGDDGRGPRPGTSAEPELAAVRRGIDEIDDALIRLLARRRDLAHRAQTLRTDDGALLRDPAREAQVLRRAVERGRSVGLPDEEVRRLYWSVVALCVPGVSDEPPAP